MKLKLITGIVLVMLLTNVVTFAFNIQPVSAVETYRLGVSKGDWAEYIVMKETALLLMLGVPELEEGDMLKFVVEGSRLKEVYTLDDEVAFMAEIAIVDVYRNDEKIFDNDEFDTTFMFTPFLPSGEGFWEEMEDLAEDARTQGHEIGWNLEFMRSTVFFDYNHTYEGTFWDHQKTIDKKSGVVIEAETHAYNEEVEQLHLVLNDTNVPLNTTSQEISIVSPENKTYDTSDISLLFSVDESVSWMGYSLDGQANVTITGNTTLTGLSAGMHNLTLYLIDTTGNTKASDTIYFIIEIQQQKPFPWWILGAVIAVMLGVGVTLILWKRKNL